MCANLCAIAVLDILRRVYFVRGAALIYFCAEFVSICGVSCIASCQRVFIDAPTLSAITDSGAASLHCLVQSIYEGILCYEYYSSLTEWA